MFFCFSVLRGPGARTVCGAPSGLQTAGSGVLLLFAQGLDVHAGIAAVSHPAGFPVRRPVGGRARLHAVDLALAGRLPAGMDPFQPAALPTGVAFIQSVAEG